MLPLIHLVEGLFTLFFPLSSLRFSLVPSSFSFVRESYPDPNIINFIAQFNFQTSYASLLFYGKNVTDVSCFCACVLCEIERVN